MSTLNRTFGTRGGLGDGAETGSGGLGDGAETGLGGLGDGAETGSRRRRRVLCFAPMARKCCEKREGRC